MKRIGLAMATLIAVVGGVAAQQAAEAPRQMTVWRGGGPAPGFNYATPFTATDVPLADYQRNDEAAWQELERMANHVRGRLRAAGVFLGLGNSYSNTGSTIQPAKALPTGFPFLGPQFVPPAELLAVSTVWLADERWVRSLTVASGTAALYGFDAHTVYDPTNLVGYSVAHKAIAQSAAYLGLKASPTLDQLFNINGGAGDTKGALFTRAGARAVGAYAATGFDLKARPLAAHSLTEFVAAARVTEQESPESARFAWLAAGVGTGWTLPWAGVEAASAAPAGGPLTASHRALIASGGAAAVTRLWQRPWPADSNTQAWLTWLDDGIRSAGASPTTAWEQASSFITERGLAAAYVTGLVDTLALENRIEQTLNPNELSAVATSRDRLVWPEGCPVVKLTPEQVAQNLVLEIPPLAARCLRVEWAGPVNEGYVPPLSLTAYGDGLSWTDYDALRIATAHGERHGLVIEDPVANKAVKAFSLPYRSDAARVQHMTLGLVNAAPKAPESRALKLRISYGMAVAETSQSLAALVNVAPPEQGCRGRWVTAPSTNGKAVIPGTGIETDPLGRMVGASLGLQSAASAFGTLNMTPMAICAAEMGSLNGMAAMFDSAEAQRSFGGQRPSCEQTMQRFGQAATALAEGRGQGLKQGFSEVSLLTDDSIGQLASGAKSGKVSSQVGWYDPTLPVFPAGNGESDDRRSDPKATLEGAANLAVNSETRIAGSITVEVLERATECDGARGQLTTRFDAVVALPFAEERRAVPPPAIEVMNRFLWNAMTPAQRQEVLKASTPEARRAAAAGDSQGGSSQLRGEVDDCTCSSTEFFNSRREECAPRCGNYASVAMPYVRDRELARGKSREAVEAELNACPANCAALTPGARYSSVCSDAIYPLRRLCANAPKGDGAAAVNCYLDYLVRELEEPQKSEFRKTNADQIAAMDADTRKLFVGTMLDGLKSEGVSCPAP